MVWLRLTKRCECLDFCTMTCTHATLHTGAHRRVRAHIHTERERESSLSLITTALQVVIVMELLDGSLRDMLSDEKVISCLLCVFRSMQPYQDVTGR